MSVSPFGLAPRGAIGSPVILSESSRALTVFIGGVDATKYVKDPSIEISMQMGSRASSSFVIIPEVRNGVVQSTLFPEVDDEVFIIHNETGLRLFGGEVETHSKTVFPGPAGYYEISVHCTDFGVICDRRVAAKWYNDANGSYIPIIARDLVDRFLTGTGVTYDGHLLDPMYVGPDTLFNYVTVSEAFTQMSETTGTDWFITPYKELRLVSRTDGAARPAPFAIEQDNGFWRSLTSSRSRGAFWNRAIVRNSQDVTALWTDEAETDGSTLYATTYPLEVTPVVLVDDVEAVVCKLAEVGVTDGWEWYYIPGTPGLSHNQDLTAPTGGTIKIIYPSRVSAVVVAEDAPSIAEHGLFEHVAEVKDIPAGATLEQVAEGCLAEGLSRGTSITVVTQKPGLEPSQLLTVDANGMDDQFVIDQVEMREVYYSLPEWTVRAANVPDRNSTAARFFSRLIRNDRQAIDRVESNISFVLAETVEGYDNGGLTVGVKKAIRTASKSGWAKMCRLHWGSVESGTPTSSEIEIDVFKNGVSIFGSSKMIYPAGATEVQEKFYFVSNPLEVNAGDIFTIQVLSADSAAKDGFLDLVVKG